MAEVNIIRCPYCGGEELIEARFFSSYENSVFLADVNSWFGGQSVYCSVCRTCGSVVRAYVKKPEKLLSPWKRRPDKQ